MTDFLIRRIGAEQLHLGFLGRGRLTAEIASAEDLDAHALLGLHDNHLDRLLASFGQISVLRNGDVERLAEGNAIGSQYENRIAVGDVFVSGGAFGNKAAGGQGRPAWPEGL